MGADPFSVLGLKSSASQKDVKDAYRQLAKKHHPDVNPGDASAAERFKRMTSAYTEALQESSRREREGPQASSSYSGAGAGGGSRMRWGGGFGSSSPRAAGGPVNEQRFNTREWEGAHYGMHGETAEERQSQFVRNLAQQQRKREQGAAAYHAMRRARQQAGGSVGGSVGGLRTLLGTIFAAGAVWYAVYRTNRYRWQQAELERRKEAEATQRRRSSQQAEQRREQQRQQQQRQQQQAEQQRRQSDRARRLKAEQQQRQAEQRQQQSQTLEARRNEQLAELQRKSEQLEQRQRNGHAPPAPQPP